MLLRAWAAITYAGLPLHEQYRLGPTTAYLVGVQVTPGLEAALRVMNWYADGVIFAPDRTVIVEAKVKPNPAAVGQVLFYQRLAPSTPMLATRLNLPIDAVVLFGESDQAVTNFARGYGVEVAIYTPPWIAAYLQSVQLRVRSAGRNSAPDSTPST
jgi:hypothetical protein